MGRPAPEYRAAHRSPNQLSIRTAWDAQSSDLVEYAAHNAWWPETPGPFDLARAYIDERVPRQISHIRMQRSRQLLAEAAGQSPPMDDAHRT